MRHLLGLQLQALGLFTCFFAVNAVNEVTHLLDDGLGRDAQAQVVRNLPLAAALGFAHGACHGVGDAVGIQDGFAAQIASSSAYGLDERSFRTQKAFLVGIQNSDQRHLGNVQALAQQIDAHQDIKSAQTQVTQNLHPLHCVHIAVQVTHLHTVFTQVVGQLLGHALGEGCNEHPLMQVYPNPNFLQHIVHLVGSGPYLEQGVYQARRAHQLLHHLPCMGVFPVAWSGRYKNGLPHFGLELFKLQRAVV